MNTIRNLLFPDPAQQLRKCNQLVRQNERQLDRHVRTLTALESKTTAAIKAASRRRDGAQSARILAKELLRMRKQKGRMESGKAQLRSIAMQINEQAATVKVGGMLQSSAGVMKNVNGLVRMPELLQGMQELQTELMRAGVIEEMAGDMLDVVEDEDEAEEEVEAVLRSITGEKPVVQEAPVEEEQQEEDETEAVGRMRERLEALKS